MTIHTPDWVKNAIFYQIFPDRFARGARETRLRGVSLKPWGSPPEEQGYQGGDLYGIIERLDYLQELGITALYLNPIFASASNHRYHTYDYYEVDPLLGGDEALRELLDEAHGRDMYIVLDGVFNHASRGFWAFHHILENGGNSPYLDWFFIEDWPLRPYQHDADNPPNYRSWWNLPALPKFNTDNPGVRDYLLGVARYWIDFGIDGWRLDVPEEIDDDEFWRDFRRTVKEGNPEAYIVGEIWTPARRWLQGDKFDAVMNYLFAVPTLSFAGAPSLRRDYDREHYQALRPYNAPRYAAAIEAMLALYDWEINLAQLNLIDSHDTARALWIMGEDKAALRLAALLQMTMPGAPCIYYGDEIGMSGGDDPYCRAAFPWHDPAAWDEELLAFYRQAAALRHAHPALRTGSFEPLLAQGPVYAFRRALPGEEAIVVINAGQQETAVSLPLPAAGPEDYTQVWPPAAAPPTHPGRAPLSLRLPPRAALVLAAPARPA